jgi:ABC-type multidrug transport system permease subunit
LRSLPIRPLSIISGRVSADTTMLVWSLSITTLFGVLVGFRVQNGAGAAAAAFGLCVLYGFALCWLFIGLGFLAGSPQAAQGISFLVFPLTFVSSAYVPVATMPGWMQAFANHQPLTYMCDSVRLLAEGHGAEHLLGHSLSSYLPLSLVWSAGIIAAFAPLTVWKLRHS